MRTSRCINLLILLGVYLGFLLNQVAAQDFRGKIQGLVTDTSQAVIPNATVTLLNVNTQVRQVRQTNDVGLYRFDFVDPGLYTVTIEAPGFARFIQQNVQVQSQGDITINAVLRPGAIQEAVTVEASPVEVQFNTTNVGLTVDSKLAVELPRYDRNPFKLALLHPGVVDTRRQEMNPFHSWAANSIELGGGTDKKNDLKVDGAAIGVGYKASYVPNTDAIQEVNVQQNAVDAEAGHSAGGSVSMTLKSGTNEFHGSAFYLGRNPSLNAMTDRTTRTNVAARNNIWGGTLGHPIIKNKFFNFFSIEIWRLRTPGSFIGTMPTDLERAGDFSKSLNINGAVKTIYDPYTTVFDPAANKATRTPFPGNKIPADRFDPLGARVMKGFWAPNRQPDNITGLNNFAATTVQRWNYWNMSDRADWYVNEKWRVYGRFSRFETTQDTYAPALSNSELFVSNGSLRNAWSYSGDAVWTLNTTTVININGTKHGLDDDYYSPNTLGEKRFAALWPNNPWYAPFDMTDFPTYFPGIYLGSTTSNAITSVGRAGFWYQHPGGYSFSGKISQQRGPHFVKVGFEFRHSGGVSLVNNSQWRFFFPATHTADTFISPNTKLVGHEMATLLLGTLGPETTVQKKPVREMQTELYSVFVQDDYKLGRRITLNLGLRYEYDTPWHDPDHNASVGLDLTQPIPEMQQTPPQMPAQALSMMTKPYKFNGAWIFTDEKNPYIWKTQKLVLMPRAGIALRINDLTALRVGFARFVAPGEFNFVPPPYSALGNVSFLEAPYMGFDAQQSPPSFKDGIPQSRFIDPFPAATNPLIPPRGKAYGRYFGLGEDNIAWANPDFKRLVNDRMNITLSRQLPNQIVAEVTYFANFGRNVAYSRDLNQMDPTIGYQYKSAIDASVPNPFYQYLTPDKFGGNLRNQKTVPLKNLLKEYPQYGGLWLAFKSDGLNRYHALQVRVQRPFRNGYNFLVGYNYRRNKSSVYYDEVASYRDQTTLMQSNQPRHSLSIAGTYELPFGKNRAYMQNLPKALDAVLGGWHLNGAWYFSSGNFLQFGPMIATGDPKLDNPTPWRWFDTSKFQKLPAYTPRTNPWFYPGLTGPATWQLDGTIAKTFTITETIRAELKMAGYNLTNRLNRADPSTDVLSSSFGQALRQATGYTGRQLEYGLKISF